MEISIATEKNIRNFHHCVGLRRAGFCDELDTESQEGSPSTCYFETPPDLGRTVNYLAQLMPPIDPEQLMPLVSGL